MSKVAYRPYIENPVAFVSQRNRKIQKLLAAVMCALAAAVCIVFAPEIGSTAAIIGGLAAGGGSAALTIAAKHTRL